MSTETGAACVVCGTGENVSFYCEKGCALKACARVPTCCDCRPCFACHRPQRPRVGDNGADTFASCVYYDCQRRYCSSCMDFTFAGSLFVCEQHDGCQVCEDRLDFDNFACCPLCSTILCDCCACRCASENSARVGEEPPSSVEGSPGDGDAGGR